MDDLTQKLSAELDHELGTRPQMKPVNGGTIGALPKTTTRLSHHIDTLIADYHVHIEVLKRLKESL